ncbi:MAG: DUF4386 family protein [Clostridia bacterium]|jgi:hypothetical protein|nr:DUF4386 family protein [Clostridia bacterium]
MSQLRLNQVTDAKTADSHWKGLYRIGGAAGLIVVVLLPIEIIVMTAYPLPSTVIGYFTLFQSNRLIGLLDLYLLEIPVYALFVPMFLALYAALRRANESYMALATTLAIIGITVFLATNNPFSMLSLSDQYAAATTDAQRSQFLAAGQAMLANTNQRAVEGFNMGFLLVSVAGLIVSAVMLRSNIFSKVTAYVGILASALSLAEYFRLVFVPEAVLLLLFIAIASCLLLLIWYILIARRLFQLGRLEKKPLPQQS